MYKMEKKKFWFFNPLLFLSDSSGEAKCQSLEADDGHDDDDDDDDDEIIDDSSVVQLYF